MPGYRVVLLLFPRRIRSGWPCRRLMWSSRRPSPRTGGTALSILRYAREHLAPYKQIQRLEFADLPKTISGKIRRTELRRREQDGPAPDEYREEAFPELRA